MTTKLMFSILLPVGLALAQPPAAGLEGTWKGALSTGGPTLHLVLTVSKSADGVYTGAIDSVDQGTKIPIDRIAVTGESVRLELKPVNGTFEGKLNGNRLAGTWSQGVPLPLEFTREVQATAEAKPAPPTTFPLGIPVQLEVPVAPTPFHHGTDPLILVYELHITNFSAQELLLKKLEVIGGSSTLASFEGSELNGILGQPGSANLTDKLSLPAGRRAVAFFWIPLEPGAAAPASLRHRLTVGEASIEGGDVAVSTAKPVSIGPPLRGANWMALNGPGDKSGHRRSLIPVDGRAHIAQRFAIDYVQVDDHGQRFTGDRLDNKNYHAYGNDVLAVADATVAFTKDGIPQNIPGATSRAVPITLETVGGNCIVLDLGGGRFAFYAHLQPGSLRVKAGDRVKRGDVIGLVGNSGNSTEPHLHFHISNAKSVLGSEGLPYEGMALQNERVNFGN